VRRSTVILVGLATLVVAVVGLDLLRPEASPARLPTLPRLIPPGTVATLTLDRAGTTYEFRKAAGAWMAVGSTEPLPVPAADLLDGLGRELAPLYAFRRVEAALPPAEAGLDPPRFGVVLTLTTGETFVLRLGDPTPEPGGTFLQVADREGIFVVSSTIADRVSRLLGPPA